MSGEVTFEDIEIVGADQDRTQRAEPGKEIYNVYFKLSASPPVEWVEFFDREREFARHSMWRRAWIEGQHIVVRCALDEIEKYHLRDLKTDVKNSNDKYREYLAQSQRAAKKQRQEEQAEREAVDDTLGKLKFD